MRLTDKLNSDFVEAKNNLNKRKGVFVDVFVENEDDIPFWKHQFKRFDINTKIFPATKNSLNRGKQEVLKSKDNTGKFLLLCLDSDYDYLLNGATQQSAVIKRNPYIFQTYTYAIENYKCYAPYLQQIITDITLIDTEMFDNEVFMINFSKIIYPLFLYSFYYERKFIQENEVYQLAYQEQGLHLTKSDLELWQNKNAIKPIFTIEQFGNAFKFLTNISIVNNGAADLVFLEKKIQKTLASLPQISDADLVVLQNELQDLGVTNENTYLFVKGHIVLDNVVKMFLNPLQKHLKKEKIAALKKFDNATNSVNKYKNEAINDVDAVLNSHKYYVDCFLMWEIETDIKAYLKL